ncbi:MAG: DUF3298 domain-containing protein [Butyricicoccus sp.]|nr:DUF3298 domain-containing protein [Butyricicoccus sp.]
MKYVPRLAAAVLAASVLMLSSGCQSAPASSSAEAENELYSEAAPDGTVVLQITADQPDMASYVTGDAAQTIAAYYDALYAAETEQWQTELADFAQEAYAQSQEQNQVFRPYSIDEIYSVVRNDDTYLCIQRIRQSYTGGAQEEQQIFCENFYKQDGSLVALADLFQPGSDYTSSLLALLAEQLDQRMQEGQIPYDANAKENLSLGLTDGHFSLTDDSLVFVYPCYTLAPYAAGPQFFEIPFTALEGLLRTS